MKAGIKSFLLKTSILLLGLTIAHADNFTVIHNFGNTTNMTGFNPEAPLVQGPDGALYGVSRQGGVIRDDKTGTIIRVSENIYGTIFRINPDGTGFRNLYIFTNPADGTNAVAGMVLVDDTLYGAAAEGGPYGGGVLFSIKTNGTSFTHLYDFGANTNDGMSPWGTLVYSGGMLYGTTQAGGLHTNGTVFSISTGGGNPSYPVNFTGGTGGFTPYAGVIISGNTLYGSTSAGGSTYNMPYSLGSGIIFKVNTDGTGYSVLQNMGSSLGGEIQYPLFLNGNVLYGSAYGGANGSGTIFSLNPAGGNFTNLYNFSVVNNVSYPNVRTNADGEGPGPLTMVSNVLYGMTSSAGTNGEGTLFSLQTNGSQFTTLNNFTVSQGFNSQLVPALTYSSNCFYSTGSFGGAYGNGCLYSINLDGSGYTNLLNFGGSDGIGPVGPLFLTNGVLYGATTYGGGDGYGMIFEVATNGTSYTNLHSFSSDIYFPVGGVAVISNTFYGVTAGDRDGSGSSVFAMNADGSGYTNLYALEYASSPLVAVNGTLFGSIQPFGLEFFSIGANGQNYNTLSSLSDEGYGSLIASGNALYGTMDGMQTGIFEMNTNGSGFKFVYQFSSSNLVGGQCELLLVGDTFYGVFSYGGSSKVGSVFSVGTNGSNYTILHSFNGADGHLPNAPLVLANGALYGTTSSGGSGNVGVVFSVNTDGSGFAIQHSFTGGADGANSSGLVLSGNTLYGVTQGGGNLGYGTVFAITAQPVLSSQLVGSNQILTWPATNYSLQSAPSPAGIYTTISGATSPYTNALSGSQQYFRLISN